MKDYAVPPLHLTRKEKISRYGSVKDYVLAMVRTMRSSMHYHTGQIHNNSEMQSLYDLSRGRMSPEDMGIDRITKAVGAARTMRMDDKDDGSNNDVKNKPYVPVSFEHKDQITPILRLLKGEEIARPFAEHVVDRSPEGISEVEEKMKDAVRKLSDQMILAKIEGDEEAYQQLKQDIERRLKRDFASELEEQGNDALTYLRYQLEMEAKFLEGWVHYLTYGQEVYHIGILHDEPYFQNVDPRYLEYEKFPGQRYVDEASWWKYYRYLPLTTVLDEYDDYIDEKTAKELEGKDEKARRDMEVIDISEPFSYHGESSDALDHLGGQYRDLVRVVHYYWVGRKRIGLVVRTEPTGYQTTEFVDEDYKKQDGEEITWSWINQVEQAIVLGNDYLLHYGPLAFSGATVENPNKIIPPFTGIVSNYSLVKALQPHQKLYNRIWMRFELMIARAKGQGFVMDVAQIPNSIGIGMTEWLHYLDVFNIAFINSKEPTKNDPNASHQFNQFQNFNMTLSQSIGQMLLVLDKIEDMMGTVSGVTRQRLGQIQTSEQVGNVQRSTRQSSHITEPFFYDHGLAKKRVAEHLLAISQEAWPNGKKAQWLLSDFTRATLNATEDYPLADFGVFISNSTEDTNIIEQIKQLSQAAVQAGTTSVMKDVVKILKSKSVAKAERLMEEAEERMMAQAQQQQQAEAQAAQAAQDAQIMMKQAEIEGQGRIDMAIEKAKGHVQLAVANLNADTKEQVEGGRLAHAQRELDAQIAESLRELGIEKEALSIKREEVKVKASQKSKPASK